VRQWFRQIDPLAPGQSPAESVVELVVHTTKKPVATLLQQAFLLDSPKIQFLTNLIFCLIINGALHDALRTAFRHVLHHTAI
jgi:hypothetical protein